MITHHTSHITHHTSHITHHTHHTHHISHVITLYTSHIHTSHMHTTHRVYIWNIIIIVKDFAFSTDTLSSFTVNFIKSANDGTVGKADERRTAENTLGEGKHTDDNVLIYCNTHSLRERDVDKETRITRSFVCVCVCVLVLEGLRIT